MTQPPLIDISVQHAPWTHSETGIRDIHNLVLSVLGMTFEKSGLEPGNQELSIVLADNDFIQGLNKEWRGKDKPTNVLSFPQDEPGLLGDIVLAFETVHEEARLQEKRFEDHVTHLLVHGLLHLLGHDHEEDLEAEEMESLEIEILSALGVKNPYKVAS